MPLRELQNGGLVTPWRDKQETATGICGTKMTLTGHGVFLLFWYSCIGTEVTKASMELVILVIYWEMKTPAEDHRITVWPQNEACDHSVLQEYLFICIMGVGLFHFCKETSMSFPYCSLHWTPSLFIFYDCSPNGQLWIQCNADFTFWGSKFKENLSIRVVYIWVDRKSVV